MPSPTTKTLERQRLDFNYWVLTRALTEATEAVLCARIIVLPQEFFFHANEIKRNITVVFLGGGWEIVPHKVYRLCAENNIVFFSARQIRGSKESLQDEMQGTFLKWPQSCKP